MTSNHKQVSLLVLVLAVMSLAAAAPQKYNCNLWLRVECQNAGDRAGMVTLVSSDAVLDAVLLQEGISELSTLKDETDKKDWLSKNLQVGFLGGSEILQVAVAGKNADDLVVILKAVSSAYMDEAKNRPGIKVQVVNEPEVPKIQRKPGWF